jgi:hypothetical protein
MTAWLDIAIPPLDHALGFYLLLAVLAAFGLLKLWDRACARADERPDPYAEPHGDVTRRPETR